MTRQKTPRRSSTDPLGYKMILNVIKYNLITWFAFLGLWMFMDYIYVNSGMGKENFSHFGKASIAFFLTSFKQLSQRTEEERYRFSFVISVALTGAWFVSGIIFLLIFDILIGVNIEM